MGAQVNPTAAQIKTQYESNANTNAFTDGEKTKLGGIQTGAQVNAVTTVAGRTGAVVLVADDIPNLDAGKINTGAFAAARIPNLDASKINAGVFNVARIPDLSISKIVDLQTALNAKLDANSTIDGGDL